MRLLGEHLQIKLTHGISNVPDIMITQSQNQIPQPRILPVWNQWMTEAHQKELFSGEWDMNCRWINKLDRIREIFLTIIFDWF